MRTMTGLVLVLAAVAAQAADSTLDAGRRCAQVKDSLERLVCFDRVFAADSATRAATPAVVSPAPAVAPASAAAPLPAAPPPPAVVRPVPAPVAAPGAATGFGEEQVKRTEKERQSDDTPRSLTAGVVALREYRKGLVRMTLDNGQVWDQMDMDALFRVAQGDTVQIEKGRMGGYRMARTSGSRSGWTRVTRVK